MRGCFADGEGVRRLFGGEGVRHLFGEEGAVGVIWRDVYQSEV